MNIASQRIWCYICKREVLMETVANSSNAKDVNSLVDEEDSIIGRRENNTFISNKDIVGCRSQPYEANVGLNVGSGGDSTDCSDSDEFDNLRIDKPAGLVGLQNIGNTCYMNAALQALSNTTPLTRFFLDCPYVVQLLSEGKVPGLSRTYQSLMCDIWMKKNGAYVSASGILYGIRSVHPMFRGYHQHDTQEFLRNFMDQLHEELKQQSSIENISQEPDTFASSVDEVGVSSSYDSSEGEYETCDSGVSERSSLSDDNGRPTSSNKRRLSRSTSPGRRLRARLHSYGIIDCQPSTTYSTYNISSTKKPIKYRSIISDIFDGRLLSSVQCLTCNRISSRIETFQDLSLPIPPKDHLILLHGRGVQPASFFSESVSAIQDGWFAWIFSWLKSWFYGPVVTLHDCLAAFFSTDELKGDNMYSCEKCNKLRNGVKFSKVLQLPEVLCIHLKRFRHELMFSSKISSAVSFPLKGLEMKPYLHNDCVSKVTTYDLFSVICHQGTAGGGHYISFALNNGQWYEFDDQYITKVSAEKVENCEAYVLFYKKSMSRADKVKTKVLKLSKISEDFETDFAYLSKQWVNRFNTCAEPGPIDNSDFTCQHGSINPSKGSVLEQLSVVVPLRVYDYLHKTYGGSPSITCLHICTSCQALNKRLLTEKDTIVQLTAEAQNQNKSPTHLLSTSWYTQWQLFVNRKIQESPGPIDNSKVNINQLDLNHYVSVPEEVWLFLLNIYGGGPEIRLKQESSEISDNEGSIELEEKEDVVECGTIEFKKSENSELDRLRYCHGEPMDLECNRIDEDGNTGGNKEYEEYLEDCNTYCAQENENLSNVNHNLSSSTTDFSIDNADVNCKNNNVHISGNPNKKKVKVCLD